MLNFIYLSKQEEAGDGLITLLIIQLLMPLWKKYTAAFSSYYDNNNNKYEEKEGKWRRMGWKKLNENSKIIEMFVYVGKYMGRCASRIIFCCYLFTQVRWSLWIWKCLEFVIKCK